MLLRRIVGQVGKQSWLARVDEVVAQSLSGMFGAMGPGGVQVKNVLHGTWLGHPLHPALTDIPTGAWTAAAVFDGLDVATGRDEFGRSADLAIGVGVAGAMGAALSGLADWSASDDPARKAALIHGLLNIGGVTMYLTSMALRMNGARGAGQGIAAAAYGATLLSAWIGGDLISHDKLGVDHGVRRSTPKDFTPALPDADLPENEIRKVRVKNTSIILVRRGGQILALNETCTHLGGPLSEGTLEGEGVVCPWHGSRFSLQDGRVLDGPATFPVSCYETRVRDGQIEVRSTVM